MYLSGQFFFETPHKVLKIKKKKKQTNQKESERRSEEKSGRVTEMHFPAIWRPKFQTKQAVKKLWAKTALDKSAWIKP